MELGDEHHEPPISEFNRASERGEQFNRFLKLAIEDDRTMILEPSGSTVQFRAITIRGMPYQLTAFRPSENDASPWRARITIGDKGWDWLRGVEADLEPASTPESAMDVLEYRLRQELAPVRRLDTRHVDQPVPVGSTQE